MIKENYIFFDIDAKNKEEALRQNDNGYERH